MQIIIPMSGFGERFRRAGYTVPKPLIEMEGKPIIAHVIDMFPGETNFIFICNEDHLANPDYDMEAIIRRYCSTARIIGIHALKLGPVYATLEAAHLVDPNEPVVVNYCDFTCYWDWVAFKAFTEQTQCAGAIPAYKDFHPHTLGSTNYAYMREQDGLVQDIQEKQPYTDNRMNEYASSGTYYFASGQLMLDAFRATMDNNLHVNGEFYVSLAYKYLFAHHLPVRVYPLEHFMQWGTPEDVAEYNRWSDAFRRLMVPAPAPLAPRGTIIIPMAGLGQRFVNEGYTVTKPLIPVSGLPMVIQAVRDLPPAEHHVFVLRSDMPGYQAITTTLKTLYPSAVIATVPNVTKGQALTALIGVEAFEREKGMLPPGPITFGACDNGALYAPVAFQTLVDSSADVIVWGVRGHPAAVRHPHMFGWIDTSGNHITRISVKEPLQSPATDPIVLGTFTFKRADDFKRVVAHMVARDGRVNGEFYIDTCINDALGMGLECILFEVDSFLSWGTPNDLRTYEYWESCFHQWASHPFCLDKATS